MLTLVHDINILLTWMKGDGVKCTQKKILIDTALTLCNDFCHYQDRTLQIIPWLNHKEYRTFC